MLQEYTGAVMETKKPFIITLANSKEIKLPWNEWDHKWEGHVSYWDKVNKMCDPVLGVNAIANAVAKSAKNNHYGLLLDNFILTISVYDFMTEV